MTQGSEVNDFHVKSSLVQIKSVFPGFWQIKILFLKLKMESFSFSIFTSVQTILGSQIKTEMLLNYKLEIFNFCFHAFNSTVFDIIIKTLA